MANIVITAVGGQNYYKATMNDMASAVGFEYIYFWKEEIQAIQKDNNNDYISLALSFASRPYRLCAISTNNALVVDSVLGVAVSDIDDLATKIANLRG